MTVHTWLIEIPGETCEELLTTSSLGRLAVIVDGRPEIFPVNHVFDTETRCILFPTNRGTKLHAALNWPSVAFEVDGTGPERDRAWSVLVVGRAEEVDDPDEIRRASAQRHVLWRSDDAATWVRIVPSRITGRRIAAAAF